MDTLLINAREHAASFKETAVPNDTHPCLRVYCTQHRVLFNLQIRDTLPLETDKGGKKQPRNLIATISLNRDEILHLAEYVKNQTL